VSNRPLIANDERRARLARRHHLTPQTVAASPNEASNDIVGFHGTDPTSVYLAAWARVSDFRTSTLETALYEDRSLLKILGMRRTMFVVPIELAGIIQSACTEAIGRRERARLIGMIEGAGIATDGRRWLDGVEAETLEVLHGLGEATAADLTKQVAGLRAQITFGQGRRWQGTVGVSTRLLFLLSSEGRIIRGRPKGSLVSSLYRWVPMDTWVPGGLPDMSKAEAQAELVRRWLSAFGPGTRRDVQWWTGWTVAETRRALAAIDAVEVDLEDGGTGFVLPDDLEPAKKLHGGSWMAFLPALDATTMGWNERDWYLGAHKSRVFDANGNAGPTIWLDGRIVGGWAQRRGGEIVFRILDDVGADAMRGIEEKAADLQAWLGELRFLPRFRTPVEQELGDPGAAQAGAAHTLG
jgi:hypothetical protein